MLNCCAIIYILKRRRSPELEKRKMKTITANKMKRVNLSKAEDGVVAFQMVEFVVSFFGNEIVSELDTKIMEDGSQVVIEGDGFIPTGYLVA